MESSRRYAHALPLTAIAFIALLAFARTIHFEFVWDDEYLILEGLPRLASSAWSAFTQDFFAATSPYGYFRPLITLSYLVDAHLWGLSPAGFHLTNVLLHVVVSWMVYLLAYTLGVSRGGAFTAGLLFAVHPVHVESVAWIAGRTDVLTTLAMILTLLLFLRTPHPPLAAAYVAAGFSISLLCKESAIVFPILVALFYRYASTVRSPTREMVAALVVPPALYLIYRSYRVPLNAAVLERVDELGGYASILLSIPQALQRYVAMWFLPIEFSPYYQVPLVSPEALLRVVIGWLILLGSLALIAGTTKYRTRTLLLATLTSLLPVMNLPRPTAPIDMGFVVAERFMYLPSVFLAIALGVWTTTQTNAARFLVYVGVTGLFVLTLLRASIWNTNLTLFSHAATVAPNAPLIRRQLALAYAIRNDLYSAQEHFRWLVNDDPTDGVARYHLAATYELLGNETLAERWYRRAVRVSPGLVEAGMSLARFHTRASRLRQARHLYRRLSYYWPQDITLMIRYSEILSVLGRRASALRLLEEGLRLTPLNPVIIDLYLGARMNAGKDSFESLLILSLKAAQGVPTSHHTRSRLSGSEGTMELLFPKTLFACIHTG